MNGTSKPPQISLILRLLGGGYLLYLAWSLLGTANGNTLYILAAVFFALVGAVLLLHTLLKISRGEYTTAQPPEGDGESENNEENLHEES
ncbi:MAG: hypothetical protein SOW84_06185 [Candidatus Faecousia sp.]|nr:hypothetical protein [Candidatus Faecousia sp.]